MKVDWNLSNTQNVSVRGSYDSNFSPAGAPNGRNSVTTTNESKDRTFVIAGSLNSVPSNRFLNTARFMVNREDSWVEFPMQGGRENMRNFSPRIQIGGNTGGMFGRGNGGGGEHNFETKWEFNDTVTLYRDSHTFKIGRRLPLLAVPADQQLRSGRRVGLQRHQRVPRRPSRPRSSRRGATAAST